MGYACPVCVTPQRDGEHLAHHLAFTAMLHGDDHEEWLDEHVPGWGEMDPPGLAERVVPHAESAEYPEVFEDTVDRGRPDLGVAFDGQDGHAGHGGHAGHSGAAHGGDRHGVDPAALDPEAAAAVREARELTERMIDDAAPDDPDDSEGPADSEGPEDPNNSDDADASDR
ncbi:DUF5810 domain-containing protein [Halorubrum vacuolatum]|uniref:Uncharacterized protein n=1 Tax=Halorubrum vacuolatum TaxID=63740 RepID=A0A238VXD3_HALVU|nr:DUF5810 domain-containing protein [Halorubrum vacuolatum]SNR38898.1 hypothetical protein SAMN06264855_104182 [Halorubrum vacuolatum]